MKHAQLVVMDAQGAIVWEGSLYRYCRDNSMDRMETRQLIGELTELNDGRPEPVFVGGGAAPLFMLSLAA
jgi:hypothetical protein